MHRAVPFVAALVVVLGLAATVEACTTHSEADPAAEGPPRSRLTAATQPSPPHPDEPPAPMDPRSAVEPRATPTATGGGGCADGMVLVDGEACTEVRQTCVEWEDPPTLALARCAR